MSTLPCTCPMKTADDGRIVPAGTDQKCPQHGWQARPGSHCPTCTCGVGSPIVQVPSVWQPRATAPRDGRHILVADLRPDQTGFGWFGGVRCPFAAVVHHWNEPNEEGFYLSSGAADCPVFFTHWREIGTP